MPSVTTLQGKGTEHSFQAPAEGPRQTQKPGALDKNANNYGNSSENGDFTRIDRWVARGVLWDISSLPRVKKCGRVTVRGTGHVDVRRTEQTVGYAGLHTCGSVWACMVCNAKIQAVRRLEIGAAIAAASERGSIAFGAYTLRHHLGQDLSYLWKSLSYGYNRMAQDKAVRKLRAELRQWGYVRAQEVTYGAAGWHPHSHPLAFFDRAVTAQELDQLHQAQFRAWSAALNSRGLEAPTIAAQSLKLVTDPSEVLGDYLAKSVFEPRAVGFEMTSTQTKEGRNGSRTPWQIFADFQATGDVDQMALWHAWERGSKGKRALTWGRGTKDALKIAEREDEEIASEEIGDRDDVVLVVTDWKPIVRRPELGAGLLAAVRVGGFAAGAAFCEWEGIPYAGGGER